MSRILCVRIFAGTDYVIFFRSVIPRMYILEDKNMYLFKKQEKNNFMSMSQIVFCVYAFAGTNYVIFFRSIISQMDITQDISVVSSR